MKWHSLELLRMPGSNLTSSLLPGTLLGCLVIDEGHPHHLERYYLFGIVLGFFEMNTNCSSLFFLVFLFFFFFKQSCNTISQRYFLICCLLDQLIYLTVLELPLGGFVNTYTALCDYYGHAARDELCWDMEHTYSTKNIRTFDLNEIEQPLHANDIRA